MTLHRRHELWLVSLIALHSFGVGLVLLTVPDWALRLGGWPGGIEPDFFGRQAGIFHVVLATGYLVEYLRHRRVELILVAKSIAVAFLGLCWLLFDVPWPVPLCGLADGAMGLAALLTHRAVVRGEAGRPGD